MFGGATVATRDMRSSSVKKWQIKPSGNATEKDILIVNGRAENEGQAQAKAKGALKEKNKDKITGTITVPGNVKLVAGVNINLTGIGDFSGKWHVESSQHDAGKDGGYSTNANLRKVEKK